MTDVHEWQHVRNDMGLMEKEQDLIPYQPARLPGGPWLIFAPHPDDEVFGMGGTIILGAQAGIRVEVVVMTGGEGAGVIQVRRAEAQKAGAVAGVAKYHFQDLPDRYVESTRIDAGGLKSILDSLQPRTIFLPGIQEFHPDHRATTKQIMGFLQSTGFTGYVWMYEISRQGEVNRLVDISPVMDRKNQAILCFRSQLALVDYQDVVLGLNRARSYTLGKKVKYAEGFWECRGIDDLLLEFRRRFEEYCSCIEKI